MVKIISILVERKKIRNLAPDEDFPNTLLHHLFVPKRSLNKPESDTPLGFSLLLVHYSTLYAFVPVVIVCGAAFVKTCFAVKDSNNLLKCVCLQCMCPAQLTCSFYVR
ncbi:hypothetical protein CHARACLAT_028013 [Characodon lateralis]|uniref:Uncharacterized protein n=1 Tax=Characodon lateralis TaxID=208331 RepID=A0ABU7E467_9TELE|nr:hypothetical protein [Characodon lateralis]